MRSPDSAGPPPSRGAWVVVAGDDVYEDLFGAAEELSGLLAAEGWRARAILGGSRLARLERDTALVVLCTAAAPLGEAAVRGLVEHVRRGGGLLACHASNVLAPGTALARLVGSTFVGHGPRPHESRFRVVLDAEHEVTRAVEPFEITHEHYRLDLEASARPIAWREDRDGRQPLVHVQEMGEGRVCYIQFGHDRRSWTEPGVRRLVVGAARWTTAGAAA